MHAFPTPKLRIKLDLNANSHYIAIQSTRAGAPLRVLTIRDTIGDLPALTDGDNIGTMPISFVSIFCMFSTKVILFPGSRKESEETRITDEVPDVFNEDILGPELIDIG
nr:DNA (cytosine-5)-methyltransferase 1A-like [Ipomoea batatas]